MKLPALILTAIIMALPLSLANAGEPLRPVTSSYTLESGSAHLHDTYLTPLGYDGMTAAFSYRRAQAMKFNPRHWIMQLNLSVGLDHTENPARNATMWGAGMEAQWNMLHRWSLPHNLTLAAGGGTSVDLGALYLDRNQNNPVSAKASWTLRATGFLNWNTRLRNVPVTLRYQPSVPLTGIFFSQEYDELYYEIYLGNHRNLIHPAWWGNYFAMENLLTADLHFGSTRLTVGYRNTILSTKVSDITTRMTTHAFIIGISGEWLSIRNHTLPASTSSIISAY